MDNGNFIALLISAIEESPLIVKVAKDDEFYLGDGDGQLSQVHLIISGGPSREKMAPETETAPRKEVHQFRLVCPAHQGLISSYHPL